jgi:hypothetical protein
MDKKGTYTQAEYAELKQVSKPYINKLMRKQRLITTLNESKTKSLIVDCETNDKLFKNKD